MNWRPPATVLLPFMVAVCASISGLACAATAMQVEAGRKIYNFRCYFCHGYSGNAQTVAANLLTPPPIDFTGAKAASFTSEHIASVLQNGKKGTAMPSFRNVLTAAEIGQVAAFVMDEFIRRKAPNTRYHTPENGWPDHQRYRVAFPFATGEIPVSRPWQELNEEQVRGKRLFLSSCVTCHDRGGAARNSVQASVYNKPQGNNSTPVLVNASGVASTHKGLAWEAYPLSYPRNNYSYNAPAVRPTPDAMASASPYLLHDTPPKVVGMNSLERQGQKLWQGNCAFCHAADGTGKNWIGSFLEPHPRNLRDPLFMGAMTRARLHATIREGLPDTSMPAWKSVLSDKEITAVIAYIAKAFHPLPN